MKRFKKTVYTLMLGFAATVFTATAAVTDLPLTLHKGKTMHYYEVQPKETIYSISHSLGITEDYLIECNPEVADGLKAYTTLYFPLQSRENNRRTISHEVKKGETIYGLGKKLGVSPETLIAQNPDIADGLRVGQVVTVTLPGEAAAKPDDIHIHTVETPSQTARTTQGYVVGEGETFYSIARKHGITVSRLEDANPTIGVLKAGDVLVIPDPNAPVMARQPEKQAEKQAEKQPDTTGSTAVEQERRIGAFDADAFEDEAQPDKTSTTAVAASRPVAIGVMLPFMLSQKTPDKTGRRMTEFLQGMLMAVDTLKAPDRPVHLYIYDTAASDDSVKSILNRPALKDMDVIIGPDNEQHFAMIAEWGAFNGVNVYNTFLVKNELYDSNEAVMQSNIPTNELTSKAIRRLFERFPDHTPVIIRRKEGPTDKSEFTDELIEAARTRGRDIKELTYTDKLKAADLAPFETGEWLFIPISGRQTELDKILPAMASVAEQSDNPEQIVLAGYPEWISFRGKTLDQMKKVNTVVYTRFYCDEEDLDARDFNRAFEHWFKHQPSAGLPRQAMLGYDTASYLINALRHNGGNFSAPTPAYTGLQNSFDFVKAGSGMVNSAGFLLNFRPSGVTEKWPL